MPVTDERLAQLTDRLESGILNLYAQLILLSEALQADIDALTARRKELYGKKREGEDMEDEIAAINGELRPLRRDLRTCGRIEADIPRIRENVRLCQNPEEYTHIPDRKRQFGLLR